MNNYFDAVFLINLARRVDRLAESDKEAALNGFWFVRWEAYDNPTNGHAGCTRSHRELLRHIANSNLNRVLILEDDFAAVTRSRLKLAGFKPDQEVWRTHSSVGFGYGNIRDRFTILTPHLPEKWDCLYLGGGYAERPISRYNQHVIRCAGMKGTGSVGVTREFAQKFTEAADAEGGLNHHIGPIDDFYSRFSRDGLHYCLQPRLIFQRESLSDISGQKTSYLFLGTDPTHEAMV